MLTIGTSELEHSIDAEVEEMEGEVWWGDDIPRRRDHISGVEANEIARLLKSSGIVARFL